MSDTPDLARIQEVAEKAAARLTEWLDDFDRNNADDHDNDDFEVGQDELIEVPAEALRATLAAQRPLLDRIAELEGEREIQRIELIRSDNRADALYHRALAAEAQVSALQAQVAKGRGGLGWLYVGDDGIEWSANHPVRSGEMPDARLIRRATNRELLSALKDAWEAHGEAVRSEGLLRGRWADAADRARALQAQVDGLREVGVLQEALERAWRDCGAMAPHLSAPVINIIGRHMAHHIPEVVREFSQPPADEAREA